jgi:hypothetical protein
MNTVPSQEANRRGAAVGSTPLLLASKMEAWTHKLNTTSTINPVIILIDGFTQYFMDVLSLEQTPAFTNSYYLTLVILYSPNNGRSNDLS